MGGKERSGKMEQFVANRWQCKSGVIA